MNKDVLASGVMRVNYVRLDFKDFIMYKGKRLYRLIALKDFRIRKNVNDVIIINKNQKGGYIDITTYRSSCDAYFVGTDSLVINSRLWESYVGVGCIVKQTGLQFARIESYCMLNKCRIYNSLLFDCKLQKINVETQNLQNITLEAYRYPIKAE